MHYNRKLEGGYFPKPPWKTKALKWETKNLYLIVIKNTRHLKIDARILN
jgi:hypothetical protein